MGLERRLPVWAVDARKRRPLSAGWSAAELLGGERECDCARNSALD